VNGFLDDFMKFVSAQSLALRGGIGEGAFGSSVILSSEQKQKFTETGNGKETPGMFQYNDNTTIHAINRSASRDDLLQKPLQITSWSLIRALVDSGKCRIAIVHGTEDPIVPYTSSVGLFEALLNTIRDDRRGRNPMTERDAEKEIHDIYAERGSTHGQNDDDSVPHNRRPEGSIRLYEIPHIGHTPHEECPEAFTHIINDIIHDWLIPT
jgi:pimeloyl-ACP methyl ester carboxylesterase